MPVWAIALLGAAIGAGIAYVFLLIYLLKGFRP